MLILNNDFSVYNTNNFSFFYCVEKPDLRQWRK